MLRVEANSPQGQLLRLPQKFRAFVAGFGSGKTWVGSMDQCIHYIKHPKFNQGYFAPTYPHIRDIFFPTIEEVAHGFGLTVDIKESNKEVHFFRGPWYLGTTLCRSMDNPSAIVGFKIGNALVDELDTLPVQKARDAWRKIIARMRYDAPQIRNRVTVATTPEGFKETHRLFVEEVAKRPKLASLYGLVQARTYDNEKNLPVDYIQSLLDTYPSQLIDAYLRGQFTNLTSGTIYRNFDRVRNASTEKIRPNETLYLGMDFNVQKMASTFYVQRPNGWHAVAELKDMLDTPDMIRAIKENYPEHKIVVYPDASGNNRKSSGASESDIAQLRQARFEVRVNNRNPSVKDRISATNKQFEISRLWVNSRSCPTVASCLEKQAYDANGEPDKKSGFDHQNDATTYPIAYEFPILKPSHRVQVSGV